MRESHSILERGVDLLADQYTLSPVDLYSLYYPFQKTVGYSDLIVLVEWSKTKSCIATKLHYHDYTTVVSDILI